MKSKEIEEILEDKVSIIGGYIAIPKARFDIIVKAIHAAQEKELKPLYEVYERISKHQNWYDEVEGYGGVAVDMWQAIKQFCGGEK